MEDDIETARRYRQRAADVREIALKMIDLAGQKLLETVAEDYERMARQMEQSAESDRRMALAAV